MLIQKYAALEVKKGEFSDQLGEAIRLHETKVKQILGMSEHGVFAKDYHELSTRISSIGLYYAHQTEIDLLFEMKKTPLEHERSNKNFNMTVTGAKMAKANLKFLQDYCKGLINLLIGQNNAQLVGSSLVPIINLQQFAKEKQTSFQQLSKGVVLEILPPR